METLFFILFFFFVLTIVAAPKPQNLKEIIVDEAKVCPPHKWNWVEVKNRDGELLRHKLVCELCGPADRGENA